MSAQAVAISTTLEVSLTRYGLRQDIFKDIILNERWEGIAFLAFYGSEGTILLHSNEKMINKKLDAGELTTRSGSGTASPSHITLGTGESVFCAGYTTRCTGQKRSVEDSPPSLSVSDDCRKGALIVSECFSHACSVLDNSNSIYKGI